MLLQPSLVQKTETSTRIKENGTKLSSQCALKQERETRDMLAAPGPGSLGQSLCTEGGGGKGFTGSLVPATKYLLKSFVCTLSLPVSSKTLLLLPLYWFPLRVLCNNPKGKLSTPASSLPPDFYHGSLYAVPPATTRSALQHLLVCTEHCSTKCPALVAFKFQTFISDSA